MTPHLDSLYASPGYEELLCREQEPPATPASAGLQVNTGVSGQRHPTFCPGSGSDQIWLIIQK